MRLPPTWLVISSLSLAIAACDDPPLPRSDAAADVRPIDVPTTDATQNDVTDATVADVIDVSPVDATDDVADAMTQDATDAGDTSTGTDSSDSGDAMEASDVIDASVSDSPAPRDASDEG